MNDIDRYLDQACRSVSGSVSLRMHLRTELKEHLEEAIKELVAKGMSQDEAAKKVVEDFGEPEMVRDGLQSVYGHSVTSLFVDKAMKWKERTMKSEWRWNSATYVGLGIIVALAAFSIVFAFMWIVPVVQALYSDLGTVLPEYLCRTINISRLMVNEWWIWVIPIVGGMGLFEWKCKSENKALIRMAMGVGASVVTVAFAFFLAGAIVIPFVLLQQERVEQRSESAIIARVADAHESYQQLAQAIEDEDWTVANRSTREVRDAYRVLGDWDTMATVLASEDQWGKIQDIRRVVPDISELSRKLDCKLTDVIHRNEDSSIVLDYHAQLQATYLELKKKSVFFASHIDSEADQKVTEEEKATKNSTIAPDRVDKPQVEPQRQ
jgi:DNA-binding Lrp family transcriptional regulator